MKVINNFRLGIDDNMAPEHIGRVIAVDHFKRPSSGSLQVEMDTHFGRLAGFTEERGEIALADAGELDGLDGSPFPDYHTILIFEDGRKVRIYERDRATITIYIDRED